MAAQYTPEYLAALRRGVERFEPARGYPRSELSRSTRSSGRPPRHTGQAISTASRCGRQARPSICTGRGTTAHRRGRHGVLGADASDGAACPRSSRRRWPAADSDKTTKSIREGLMGLAKGLNLAVRNVATHTRKGTSATPGGRSAGVSRTRSSYGQARRLLLRQPLWQVGHPDGVWPHSSIGRFGSCRHCLGEEGCGMLEGVRAGGGEA